MALKWHKRSVFRVYPCILIENNVVPNPPSMLENRLVEMLRTRGDQSRPRGEGPRLPGSEGQPHLILAQPKGRINLWTKASILYIIVSCLVICVSISFTLCEVHPYECSVIGGFFNYSRI